MSRPKFKQHNKKSGKRSDSLSWVSYFIGSVLLFGVIIGAIVIFILSQNLPSLEMLEKYEPNLVTQVYSSDGRLIAEFGEEKRKLVSIDKIPKHLIDAFVAIEDQRFWNHWGVNIYRVPSAAIRNILTMDFTLGFSTLTMQLAKNLYFTPEKTLLRKIRETLTAIQIERTYTKREIMEMYLNNSFFGYKLYGIASVAQTYFNKDVSALTLEQSALLAGILPAPNRYSPERNPEKAKSRRDLVLRNMYKEKYITEKQYEDAVKTPVKVTMKGPEYRGFASYFTEYIRIFLEENKENKENIGADYMTDGLKIITTLDRRLQGIAEKAVNDKLKEHQARANRLYKNKTGISKIVQGALICIEPGTGYIRAMVGGRNFKESQFNRAVQAKRQPGSSFKPFVWATAIDNGYKVTDTILNQYVTLFMVDGSRWTPQNFDLSVGGPTTLREGLRRSLNLI
ncbi:MAG: transglycosylase domain-containing protein, partial [Patescibacteria group bacterium]|nr:transglycosylase domain-containing protein [Patescibacteria group bacterium]